MTFLCPVCKNTLLETYEKIGSDDLNIKLKIKLFFYCPICNTKFSFKLMLFEEKSNKIHEITNENIH